MSYGDFEDFGELGGFLWWILIRFCKTELKEEQIEEKMSRNLLLLIVIGILFGIVSVKFFDD